MTGPAPGAHPLKAAIAGLCLALVTMGIGRFVYTPILPFMVQGLHLSKSAAGWIGSANFLGYLAGSVVASKPHLPGGRRSWMLGALALSTASTAASGLSPALGMLIAMRFVGGAATAISFIFACSLVLDYLARAHRIGLSRLHFSGIGIGIVVSSIAVAALAQRGVDWSGLWLANGVICLVGTVLVLWLMPDTGEGPPIPVAKSSARMDQRLLRLILCYGLFGFGYVITATFISVLTRTNVHLRPLEPFIWLIVGLSSIPSLWIWDWTGRRTGYLRACAIANLVEAAGVALSVAGSSRAAVIVAAILLGGTMTGIGAMAMVGARELIKEGDSRRIYGLMTAAFSLGQIIGPVFAGTVAEATGSFLVPTLVAAVTLVLAAGLVWTRRESAARVAVAASGRR